MRETFTRTRPQECDEKVLQVKSKRASTCAKGAQVKGQMLNLMMTHTRISKHTHTYRLPVQHTRGVQGGGAGARVHLLRTPFV